MQGFFGPDSPRSPSSKSTSSHSLMIVLKIREKGGEASWLMAGSHVNRLQSQSRLKKFSPTNLANQFVQSALTASLALAALVALAPICSGPTSRHAMGGQSLDQATVTNMAADLNLVDAFEKSKSSTNQLPKIGKRRSCVCALFSSIHDVSFSDPDQPFLSDSF